MGTEGCDDGRRLEGTFIYLVFQVVSSHGCKRGVEIFTILSPLVSSILAQVNGDGSSSSAGIAHST